MGFMLFFLVIITLADTESVGKWLAEIHAWHNHFLKDATDKVETSINKPKPKVFRIVITVLVIIALILFFKLGGVNNG